MSVTSMSSRHPPVRTLNPNPQNLTPRTFHVSNPGIRGRAGSISVTSMSSRHPPVRRRSSATTDSSSMGLREHVE
jgi:hypothetical protein